MDLRLDGMRVLVTAGSAGIGLESARLLVEERAQVAIASRHPHEAASAIGAAAIAADLGTAEGADRCIAQAADSLGGLDVLVNNVGVSRIASFEELGDRDWQEAWELNVMSFL